jgi:hypothetical protein
MNISAAIRLSQQFRSLEGLVAGIGPPCWVANTTVAALLGFDGFTLKPPFHVVVKRGRNIARVGHIIHTAHVLDGVDTAEVAGLAATTATRALIDMARSLDAKRLTVAVDSAIRDGRTSEDALHHRIVALRTSGRYGLPKLLAVLEGSEIERGGHSWLEREYLRLVAASGLPKPLTQQVVGRRGTTLIRVDCRFPGTNVVVELLGYRFHRSTLQIDVDTRRMNEMLAIGLAPLQFTYAQVVGDPRYVVDETRGALGLRV